LIGRTSRRTKKARCRGDTGLWRSSPNAAKCHKRRFWAGSALFLRSRRDACSE
jgi:hypothetical protein